MDVTLTINGIDWSAKLSKFNVTHKTTFEKVITTLDHVEHAYGGYQRSILSVSFLPLTEEECAALYNDLSNLIVTVGYTDPYRGETIKKMRLSSDLQATFALRSVDGKRRYTGGNIQLRQV